jgi:hypothetical protein
MGQLAWQFLTKLIDSPMVIATVALGRNLISTRLTYHSVVIASILTLMLLKRAHMRSCRREGCRSQNVSQPTGSASEGQQALLESLYYLAGHDEGAVAMEKEWSRM